MAGSHPMVESVSTVQGLPFCHDAVVASEVTWTDLYHHPDGVSTRWAHTLASAQGPPDFCPGSFSSTHQVRKPDQSVLRDRCVYLVTVCCLLVVLFSSIRRPSPQSTGPRGYGFFRLSGQSWGQLPQDFPGSGIHRVHECSIPQHGFYLFIFLVCVCL